ncbi:MAG: peptidoglycan-binding protein, partial [Actinomycetota bacterium]|nr:peptidoglycan-binding protein [Actinomycetota bacterium]
MPVDGAYGPQTRAAVRAFQAKNGLVVDGIVGPQTLAALGIGGATSRRAGHQHRGGEGRAGHSPQRVSTRGAKAGAESGPESITRSLWDELALA